MIYLLEDDGSIRKLVIYALESHGFQAVGFDTPTDFWGAMASEIPDLLLLDIMLPGEDGITILEKLRRTPETASIPVIMATAKGSEYDKVMGLDLGADDYLCKPFGMMEMVSRIKAVLRRTERSAQNAQKKETTDSILACGDIVMDKAKHTVMIGEDKIVLTLKEYDMLRLFLENPGIVFTREQLLERVWESAYPVETRTVDVHIGTLRTKLGKNGERIRTVRGVGYKME
jgi:two-component system alkaline phosphatase synthesis response regulator PhoP